MSDGGAKTVAPPLPPWEAGFARVIPKIGLAFVALCFILAIGRMVLIPVTAFWLLAGVALLVTIAALGLPSIGRAPGWSQWLWRSRLGSQLGQPG